MGELPANSFKWIVKGVKAIMGKVWAEISFGVIAVLLVVWLIPKVIVAVREACSRKSVGKNEPQQSPQDTAKLGIGIKGVQIKTLDYYEAVRHGCTPGDKEITVNVTNRLIIV